MKIAHFSDLHFSHFVINPLQFFSKTWIGNANLLLKRGKRLQPLSAESIIKILDKIEPDLCLFTGDFTTTSQKKEFLAAQDFIFALQEKGYKTLAIPGNHDHYTKKAHTKKIFYDFLENRHLPCQGRLKTSLFEIYHFDDVNILLLDLTEATPWFTAYGVFHQNQKAKIKDLLKGLDKSKSLVVAGHFPIFNTHDSYHHALKHGNDLAKLFDGFENCYYLHGHNHNFNIIDTGTILQIDSGSLSDIQKGSFSVLDTNKQQITPFYRKEDQFLRGKSYER